MATITSLDSVSFSNAMKSELLPFLVNTLEAVMISSNSSYDSLTISALRNIFCMLQLRRAFSRYFYSD